MVDISLDQLGQFGALRVLYCSGKCAYEHGLPRPGDTEGNFAYLRCVAECSSPVPLPDRENDADEDGNENEDTNEDQS